MIGDARAIALDGLELRVRQAPPGEGTPFTGGSGVRYCWLWLGAGATELDEDRVARLFDNPAGFASFNGVWAFLAADLAGRRTLCAADRLGIQAVYYRPDHGFASTNPMWLLTATGHDGSYSPEGLADHLGFGYAIHPERQLYRGMVRLAPATYRIAREGTARTGFYWNGETEDNHEPDLERLARILRDASRISGRKPYFGLTAGKDSLCLAAAAQTGCGITFGDPACADQIQGRALAAALDWEHRRATLCQPADFSRWVHWIAEHSAGLTTASYVDMLDAVERTIPPGGAFVMGEAGECVRDFFPAGTGSPVDYLAQNYVTPAEFLRQTLTPDLRPDSDYPRRLLERAGLLEGDPAEAALRFYRNCRMPGNFAQRHAILSPLRAKLAPFADTGFIDHAYGLGLDWFRASRLHREIIQHTRPDLLRFFDHPVSGAASAQGLPARMAGPLRIALQEILEDAGPSLPECWDHAGIAGMVNLTPPPDRAVYYLLRLATLAVAAKLMKTLRN